MNSRSSPVVLVAEDDLDDRLLLQEAFQAATAPIDLRFIQNREEFLAYLNRHTPWENAAIPDLILFDMNMDHLDWQEILQQIKKAPESRSIPVVVLTSSARPEDVAVAYNLGANTYIQKPASPAELDRIIKTMCEYWFGICMLPQA